MAASSWQAVDHIPIYDWVRTFGQSWSRRFGELDTVLAELAEAEDGDGGDG
jgi:hypothetical protein